MPFLEHLEEFRRALLGSLGAIALCAIAVYAFSGTVIDWMVVNHVGAAQFIRPMEAFMARIKVSLLLGLLGSLPFVTFQIWNFVVPGLLKHERRIVMPMVVFSTLLFITGVAFSYFVLTPMMIQLLTGFSTEHVVANITVDYLLDFIIKLAVACGILFQLPLVVALLTLIDLVTPRFLWSKWRHAIVIILVVAAVATPGDGPSQLILAAPIVVLYFLSILLSLFLWRGGKKRREKQEQEKEKEKEKEQARARANTEQQVTGTKKLTERVAEPDAEVQAKAEVQPDAKQAEGADAGEARSGPSAVTETEPGPTPKDGDDREDSP